MFTAFTSPNYCPCQVYLLLYITVLGVLKAIICIEYEFKLNCPLFEVIIELHYTAQMTFGAFLAKWFEVTVLILKADEATTDACRWSRKILDSFPFPDDDIIYLGRGQAYSVPASHDVDLLVMHGCASVRSGYVHRRNWRPLIRFKVVHLPCS